MDATQRRQQGHDATHDSDSLTPRSAMHTSMLDELRSLRQQTLRQIKATPLVQSLLSGTVPRGAYASYLTDVYHYAKHSPVVISLAGSRAVGTQPELGAYLLKHAQEELGHEAWALADLRRLGVENPSERAPSLACDAMLALEYYAAGVLPPAALLGWMHVLEALGDDLGHAAAIAAPECSTFVDRHGDADHGHIREIEAAAGRWIATEQDASAVLRVARLSARLYTELVASAQSDREQVGQ